MDADKIRLHIAHLIKEKHKNLRALSLAIGKNEAYLHQFVHKGSPVRLPEEDRRKLASLLDVDEQDLTDIKLPKTFSSPTIQSKTALLEMLGADTNSGTTGFFSLPIEDFSNLTSVLPNMVKILRISGDAMLPTLKDGDYVLSDTSENSFSADGLYVIVLNNRYTVKRVQQISNDKLLLISDNTHYQSVSVLKTDITIYGKIICIFKTEKIG